MFAGPARKSGHHWSLDGCCYSLAPKAARAGRWRPQAANLCLPTADDWLDCRALIASGSFPTGASFRNLPAGGHDRWCFPELPTCACYCRRAAKNCCPRHRMMCDSSSSLLKAAGSAKGRADEESCWMCQAYCPVGYSSQARCRDGHSSKARCAMAHSMWLRVDSSRCSRAHCQRDQRSGQRC